MGGVSTRKGSSGTTTSTSRSSSKRWTSNSARSKRHIRDTLLVEVNAATAHPLVFAETAEVLSGGNFHGQPLAMAADQMAVSIATLAGISERRTEQMVNPQMSGLPAFLVAEPGLNSGFMILHVAAAALVSETRAMSFPHSVDSVPTSANQEDYVSMGMGAARRLSAMLENLRNVLAIELLAACHGLEYLAPLGTGLHAQKAKDLLRSVSKPVDKDRSLSADIAVVSPEQDQLARQSWRRGEKSVWIVRGRDVSLTKHDSQTRGPFFKVKSTTRSRSSSTSHFPQNSWRLLFMASAI